MNEYHLECIALGTLLRFPKAINYASARLDTNSFIFDQKGGFGADHNRLWLTILNTGSGSPTSLLGAAESDYAKSLVQRLSMQYQIYDYDEGAYQKVVDAIYNHSTAYHQIQLLSQFQNRIADPQTFSQFISTLPDTGVMGWSASVVGLITKTTDSATRGFQFDNADDVRDLWKIADAGMYRPYVQTGIKMFEDVSFPAQEGITVVHGVSSSGKTALTIQIALAHACYLYANNLPGCVAIASLEMPDRTLRQRMIASLARVSYQKRLMGLATPLEKKYLDDWSFFYDLLPIAIDDSSTLTTSVLSYTTTGLNVSEKGPVRLLVTDYGELFMDSNDSLEQRVASIFRNQRAISKTLGIPFIAISQSTYDKGSYIAGPEGTRYSKGILQAADQLAEVWNPVMLSKTRDLPKDMQYDITHPWLLMQKFREGAVSDAIPMGWRAECNFFYDREVNNLPGQEIFSTWIQAAVDKSGLGLKPLPPQKHTPNQKPVITL